MTTGRFALILAPMILGAAGAGGTAIVLAWTGHPWIAAGLAVLILVMVSSIEVVPAKAEK